jgi:hypothetical protein
MNRYPHFAIVRRRFGETDFLHTSAGRGVYPFTRFYDRARTYKTRAAAKSALSRMIDKLPNNDFYVVGPDRPAPFH